MSLNKPYPNPRLSYRDAQTIINSFFVPTKAQKNAKNDVVLSVCNVCYVRIVLFYQFVCFLLGAYDSEKSPVVATRNELS